MEKNRVTSHCPRKPVTLTFDPQTTRSVDIPDKWTPGHVTGRVHGQLVITATRNVCITDLRVCFVCLSGNKRLDPLKLNKLYSLKHGASRQTIVLHRCRSSHIIHVYKSHTGTYLTTTTTTNPDHFEMQGTKNRTVDFREAFSFDLEHLLPETLHPPPRGSEVYLRYVLVAWCRYKVVDGCLPGRPSLEKAIEGVVLRAECSLQSLCEKLELLALRTNGPYLPSSDLVGRSRMRWLGLGDRRDLIQCRLVLPYKGLVRGEIVPALVHVYNCSCYAISSASLHFIQELVFTGGCRKEGERGDVVREEVARAQLERVATRSQWVRAVMSLRLPERCRTDASFQACPFLAVRFIVRLKLTFRLCSSMTCDVACHVGTKRSDVPVPKPTINLDRLSIYPDDFLTRVDMESLPFVLLAPTPHVQRETRDTSEADSFLA